jgi:hypothetical protein
MIPFEPVTSVSNSDPTCWDIATANLACAQGLPGAENLDIQRYDATLESWKKFIRDETLRHAYQFKERPEQFGNSPAYFCILVMVTVLQKQLDVKYNPKRIRDPSFQDPYCIDPDFTDSRDLFIHGLIGGPGLPPAPGGTCASMPVLYVAVGRRLGYPLKLVEAKGHLFARWDDPQGKVRSYFDPQGKGQYRGDRFNIEATAHGLGCPPDEHYYQFPAPLTDRDLATGKYLKSLTIWEELALFKVTRAFCLWDNGNFADALRDYAWARVFSPEDPRYDWQLCTEYKKYRAILASKTPEEATKLRLRPEEEVAFLQGLIRGHQARLRDGKPGLNLKEFGISERVVPSHTKRILP